MTIEAIIAQNMEVRRECNRGPSDIYWPTIWPIIAKAAFEGKPCPSNESLAEAASCDNFDTISLTIRRAKDRGVFAVEYRGVYRRITLPTGHRTDWSTHRANAETARAVYQRTRRALSADRKEKVFALIVECARTGASLPTNAVIAERLGECNVKTITAAKNELVSEGRLIAHGTTLDRAFQVPGVGIAQPSTRSAAPVRKTKPKARSLNKWFLNSRGDDSARAALHELATRVESVDTPVTASAEHEAMLAAFLARGGKPMKCPNGFAAPRSLQEVLG